MFDTEERLNKKTLYIFNDYGYSDDLQYNQIINYKHLIKEFNEKYEEIKEKKFYNFSTCFKEYDYEPRLNYIGQSIYINLHNKKFSSTYRRFLNIQEKLYYSNTEFKCSDFKYYFKEFEKYF